MAGRKVDMKIVLLGREYGGKTSLVERYLHDRFTGDMPYQSTIGAAFGAKRLEVGHRTITLGIWDTAGSERYEAMSRIYYRGAKAAIVCYDLTDRNSYERAQFWISELRKNEESCRIYLCGTKKDLIDSDKNRRQVDYHTTTDLAEEVSGEVFETSSKTGEKIRELFYKIALDYANDPSNKETPGKKKNVAVSEIHNHYIHKCHWILQMISSLDSVLILTDAGVGVLNTLAMTENNGAFEIRDSPKKLSCCS